MRWPSGARSASPTRSVAAFRATCSTLFAQQTASPFAPERSPVKLATNEQTKWNEENIVSLAENDCRLAVPAERFHCFVGQRFAFLPLSFSSAMGAPFCRTAARTNDHNHNVRKTPADNASEAEEKSWQLMRHACAVIEERIRCVCGRMST